VCTATGSVNNAAVVLRKQSAGHANLTQKGAWPSNPVHRQFSSPSELSKGRKGGSLGKCCILNARELCDMSSRIPPPVVILIRGSLAERRGSLLQEIALRDHGHVIKYAWSDHRHDSARRDVRGAHTYTWNLLISHRSTTILPFYGFVIVKESFLILFYSRVQTANLFQFHLSHQVANIVVSKRNLIFLSWSKNNSNTPCIPPAIFLINVDKYIAIIILFNTDAKCAVIYVHILRRHIWCIFYLHLINLYPRVSFCPNVGTLI